MAEAEDMVVIQAIEADTNPAHPPINTTALVPLSPPPPFPHGSSYAASPLAQGGVLDPEGVGLGLQ